MSAFWIKTRNFLIGLGLIVFVGFIFWAGSNFESKTISVAGHNLKIWIADDPAEQAKGLSGKDSMFDNRGMLFVMALREVTSFWMKDMKFPLDFIWIDNGTIVGIDQNIPPCESESDCPAISPSAPVNYVLEVNAGWVTANNISIGQSVIGLPE
jgi:uncharacterized membrane protein (UPF0127 family)